MTSAKVLVVDDTKLITQMIRDKLTASGYQVEEAYDGPEALAQVQSFAPDLMILDVMLPGIDGYQIARTVRQNPATARLPIIMLTAKTGIAEKIAGFEAGADDYLTKPFDPTELEMRVRVLLARAYAARGAEPATATGKVITVFSLRGGAGVTSLAVNLATALAQLFDLEVPLVDLALEAGSDSLMLDIMPKMNLSHLAKEDVNVVDDTLIREYLQVHPSGILLLAAPSTPVLAETVEPKTIHTLLPILRRMYTHVVIDTSHQWGDLNLATFDLSDLILLIIPPDMVSVRVATATLDTFASLGYPEEKTAVVINWVFPRRGLPQKEIETALGRPILAVIPHEPEGVVRSINEGVPMIIGQPTTAWSLAVEQLAYQIAAANVRARTDAAPSRRLAMLKKRLATG